MKSSIKDVFKHLRRDAMAGTVAGVMAVPLTAGICLMSDYPIMTGIYTVIFACIVGFVSYLFKPGNYVGTPGVAAGLAPALALGVSEFGMENMPFVIFITALFQAAVWKFNLQRYILQLVPHYLVEGLLAGVGLKIALKFVPFLYDIQHKEATWLSLEREVVILLSLLSFVLFVLLYRAHKRKMPALPYFVIMVSSFALSFIIPLPRISIDSVPFELSIPLPHFNGMSSTEVSVNLIKMIGFALMLGTIDVIEQVMSNVAIEKLDPYDRKCDTNNSLQSIWIANMGATFFGGMTNLDGLAKSTTNAVAGAVTKLSNLFTALVLFMVVLFPIVLTHVPEYALGIIMVYSGWKMIANITHVRAEGRYALILAAICGLLVFEFGIFEGLLVVLLGHAIIQFIFMRRLGKSPIEVFGHFKESLFDPKARVRIESADVTTEPAVPVLNKLIKAVNAHDLESVMKNYEDRAVLTPAFSTRIRYNDDEIKDYYEDLLAKDELYVEKLDIHSTRINGYKIDSGHYGVGWKEHGRNQSHVLRFSMVVGNGKIISDHTSVLPTGDVSIALWAEQEKDDPNMIY